MSTKTTRPDRAGRIWPTLILACLAIVSFVFAASHREAPAISSQPKVDGTDFYMFRSYEPGRENFATLIANYGPQQDPYAGPNYFGLDPDARYDIHVDNNGDALEDLTFRFQVQDAYGLPRVNVGNQQVDVPFINIGRVAGPDFDPSNLNVLRTYTVNLIRGPVSSPTSNLSLTGVAAGDEILPMPLDNIGEKTFPDYAAYANQFIYDVNIPGCGTPGRVFAGPREDGFYADLAAVFDLFNKPTPDGNRSGGTNSFESFNVSSLALEVPIDCLTSGGSSDVIGGWTTARLPHHRNITTDPTLDEPDEQFGDFVQVSRLGNPLFNELVIGTPDKDRFNTGHPVDDHRFAVYTERPTLSALMPFLFPGFGLQAPTNFPRNDLVGMFLTGIPGLNQSTPPGPLADILRLNTSISSVPAAEQNNLGVLANDNAGFPNGRRVADDVVDIELRAIMGVLCHLPGGDGICTPADAPSGLIGFTDCVQRTAADFQTEFPYLVTPIAGSLIRGSQPPPPPPDAPFFFEVTEILGSNQVPPNNSIGNGTCFFEINQAETALTGQCVQTYQNVFQVQILTGQPGQNPTVACIEFTGPNTNNFNCNVNHPRWQNNMTMAELLQQLRGGNAYVNVLTSQFPQGAGVGFITPTEAPLTSAPVESGRVAVRSRAAAR